MSERENVIYNIPAELFDEYHHERLIIRTYDPEQLVKTLVRRDLSKVHYLQVLTLGADTSVLIDWNTGVPIDLVMYEPELEFAKLYEHTKLLAKHPVRITIPVRYGFASAVKTAVSLEFSVKLTVRQPDVEDLAQMVAVLYMFLYKPTIARPIEFYQSMLESFFQERKVDLWTIQEDDPAHFRYVRSDGQEGLPARLMDADVTDVNIGEFMTGIRKKLVSEHSECEKCSYVDRCGGYFKWPNKDYVCAGGIKDLFRELEEAAEELTSDFEEYSFSRFGFSEA